MSLRYNLLATAVAVGLAACGTTPGDRAVSGGAIGAGAGAVAGALGGSPLTGAVLGGAVGAAAGGLTSPNTIDLGRPAWQSW
jgi:osmotically inducible lipoprotein OsmB